VVLPPRSLSLQKDWNGGVDVALPAICNRLFPHTIKLETARHDQRATYGRPRWLLMPMMSTVLACGSGARREGGETMTDTELEAMQGEVRRLEAELAQVKRLNSANRAQTSRQENAGIMQEIKRQVFAGKSDVNEILTEVRRTFPTATTGELLSACITLDFVMSLVLGNHD
jgi:hypothetical protein